MSFRIKFPGECYEFKPLILCLFALYIVVNMNFAGDKASFCKIQTRRKFEWTAEFIII